MVKLLMIVGGVFILGVVGFLFRSPEDPGGRQAKLVVWGTVSDKVFVDAFVKYHDAIAEGTTVNYVQKDERTMHQELVEALASGKGPDIWITDEQLIQKQRNFVATPSSDILSVRTFTSSYIDAAAQAFILANSEGKQVIAAVPIWADPLVLFWNKDIFTRKSIATPPTNWTQLQRDAALLTEIRTGDAIAVSGIAMGRAKNIPEYRDILTLLLAQYGALLYDGNGDPTFGRRVEIGGNTQDPTYQAFRFYSDFGNSGLTTYSWNTQFSSPAAEFQQGRLAMMIAPSSSVTTLRQKNPHLKFDIAAVPQLEGATRSVSGTRLTAFVVNKASKYQPEAWRLLVWLSGSDGQKLILKERPLATINRSLISAFPHPEFGSLLGSSALQATHLVDLTPELTNEIFYDAVESIVDRRATVSEAIRIGEKRFGAQN